VLTDRPEARFAPGLVLHPEGSDAPLTIATAAPVEDGPGWRVGFREVTDRGAAERLRDRYLETVVDRATELEPGQAFWHEVVGSAVIGAGGRALGTVADVYRAGEAEVYVVHGGPMGEFDVPAIRDIIRVFDPANGRIEVDEEALDLAAPAVDEPARTPRKRHRWSRHGKGQPPGASGAP
jgi:16S rRNA processing protein RimM